MLAGQLDTGTFVEAFPEESTCDTNWKVLAENFMESHHLPVCHQGSIGGSVDLMQMTCPEELATLNYHWIRTNYTIPLSLAHPSNTRLTGDQRRITWLLSIYPSLMITLTPGYFWYLSLTPAGPGWVQVLFGGVLAADWAKDPEADRHFGALKALLGDVNVEDEGCLERVYKGLCAGLSSPGAAEPSGAAEPRFRPLHRRSDALRA